MFTAIIRDNIVENIVIADVNEFPVPEGCVTVGLQETTIIGSAYDPATGALTPPPPLTPPVPESITRRQCARQLFAMGMITGPEAVAMTRNGTPPAMAQAYLDGLPDAERYVAEMDFAADNYLRGNQLLKALMAANGFSIAQGDGFFITAATL